MTDLSSGSQELAMLFSGGTDSTYTAVLMRQRYRTIHLLTFERFGFLNTKNSLLSLEALREKFPDNRFVHRFINIDRFYQRLSYGNYFRDLLKYRFYPLLTCALCKLAMHWQTMVYCLDRGISAVCDGSNREMRTDPSQDAEIIRRMESLYGEFGIHYSNPIFEATRQVREQTVFDLGLFPVQHPKWTRFSRERQPFCTQEHLLLKFLQYATTGLRQEYCEERARRYRSGMLDYHRSKRDFIRTQVRRYLQERR